MEFSKKALLAQMLLSAVLCLCTVIATFQGRDALALAQLAERSLYADIGIGGLYMWKAKNENRSKYSMRFIKNLADKYGFDSVVSLLNVILKD